jgi:hypothetical protein
MVIRSDREIYQVIEKYLRDSSTPMTCVDLMDIPEVFKVATEEFGADKRQATNKLSDTLGFMWRREVLKRYPTSGANGQLARYAYLWAESDTRPTQPIAAPTRSKTGVIVEERDDGIMIEFDKFFVFVRPK